MSISKLISFLICIITWKICLTNGTCPSPFIVQPCRCLDLNETRVIKCVHIELNALRNVFHKMSVQLDDDSKTFDAFYLGKSDMRMIPENIFLVSPKILISKFVNSLFSNKLIARISHSNTSISKDAKTFNTYIPTPSLGWPPLLNFSTPGKHS